ncbi:hypothetical protein KG892_01700 [Vermiphilus pyriformis]|nr:MAG: hypothetical protein KG892_01700 [Vermiphilus pyriformis]
MIKQHAQRKLVLFSFLQDNRISSRCFDAISSLETESQEKEATTVAVNTLCSINKCNVIKTFIKNCKTKIKISCYTKTKSMMQLNTMLFLI